MAMDRVFLPRVTSPAPFGGPKVASNSGLPNIPQSEGKGRVLTHQERTIYAKQALDAARRNNVAPHLLIQQIQYQSGFNPTARAKGLGLAQLGVGPTNPFDNRQSLDVAAKSLRGKPW